MAQQEKDWEGVTRAIIDGLQASFGDNRDKEAVAMQSLGRALVDKPTGDHSLQIGLARIARAKRETASEALELARRYAGGIYVPRQPAG